MDPNFRPRKYPKEDLDKDFSRFKKRIIIGIIIIFILTMFCSWVLLEVLSPYINKVEKHYMQPADTVITIRNGHADTVITIKK